MGIRRFWTWLVLVGMLFAFGLPTISLASDRSEEARGSENRALRYLALGDSIAYGIGGLPPLTGYVYHYRDFLTCTTDTKVELENLSKPGLSTTGLLKQIEKLGEMNADIVTVSIGGNNVLGCGRNYFQEIDVNCAELGLTRMAKDWQKIIAEIKKSNPNAYIQVMNLYNPFAKGDRLYDRANQIILEINRLIRTQQQGQYSVVDVYSAFNGKENVYTFFPLLKDPHPTGLGHYVIAKLHYQNITDKHGDATLYLQE